MLRAPARFVKGHPGIGHLAAYTAPMATLDHDAYRSARAFLERGRALEAALFTYALEDGPAWHVLDALAAFRNPDGGFGHGLEPDVLCGATSALATSVALRRLAEIAAPPGHALVEGGAEWARRTIDPGTRTWRIVPPEADEAPHAPWWDQDGLEERFHGFALNPKADLVAQLFALSDGDDGWLDQLAGDVVREIEHRTAAASALDMHEIIACVALADAPHVPVSVRHRLVELLAPIVDVAVLRDPDAWRGYGLRPLAVAPRPGCAFAGALHDVVHAELDYLIAAQAPDGAWWPTWTWGRDDAVWERQREAWASVLTLDTLTRLHAHGRLGR